MYDRRPRMRQRALEMRLQALEPFNRPKAKLEQYATPAQIAADVLYTAHGLGDIESKKVLDLGCGTGIFSIGACMLGAGDVTGLDIDEDALDIARRNAERQECNILFVLGSVEAASGRYDTCIMNPPFGSQNRHADLPFLDKAMELANVVYSMHNHETAEFLRRRLSNKGWNITLERKYKFEIRHTFGFHTKDKAYFDVIMLRTVKP